MAEASEAPPPPLPPLDSAIIAAAHTLLQRCDQLAQITDVPGTITRTFLSPASKQAHALVTQWMQAAGLTVRTDPAGNLIGRREADASLPNHTTKTLAIGSHLDTVPDAGKYDGILGVLAGIALADLTRNTPLPCPLEIVAFSEEEGVRFGKPYIGSHAYAGTLDPTWLQLTDKNGTTVEQAIKDFGLDPPPFHSLTPRIDLLAYLELHIEQGPELERANLPLAPVTAIAGQTRTRLRLAGTAGHAGTVPMDLRHDALAAAAEIILLVESIARSESLVATVGHITNLPNASNVIPGEVLLSLDLRHADDLHRRRVNDHLLAQAKNICERRHIAFAIENSADFPAVPMNRTLVGLLLAATDKLGAHFLLHSGAGHDAAILAPVCPTAMLFLRSPGGISHNPAESVHEPDVALALATLHQTVLSLPFTQD